MQKLGPLPSECPLCGKATDSLMHTLLWCEIMQKLRIERHNRMLRYVLEAVQTKWGKYWVTGDLPGWGRTARCSPDMIIDRDPLEEQEVPVSGAALGDDDWENPEAEEESEVGTIPPGEQNKGKVQKEETEEEHPLFDPELEPSGLQTRDILPECWNYKGARRPDGMLIKGMTPAEKQAITAGRPDCEYLAMFFDITCTSENSITAAFNKKHKQYAALIDGPPMQAQVLPLAIGARGFIPQATSDNLARLGLGASARKELERVLSRTAIIYCSKILMTRRKLEHGLNDARTRSGAVRYDYYRSLEKKLRRESLAVK